MHAERKEPRGLVGPGARCLAPALALALTATGVVAQGRHARNGSMPSVSPDGQRIAFGADRDDSVWQIYVVNADGTGLLRLTDSREDKHSPSWSADGRFVHYLCTRDDTTLVYAVPRGGGGRQTRAARPAKALALSPDGRRIAYTVGSWTRNRLLVGPLEGGRATAVTDSSGSTFNLAWSPDGRRLAMARRDSTNDLQVWVMDADGGNARPLTRFALGDGRPQWPAWSPDGRTIAIQAGVYPRGAPEKSSAHIWVIDVASGAATRLAAHAEGRLDETPSWFPDGKRLAFQSDRTGRMEIWVMNADGTEARQVTR